MTSSSVIPFLRDFGVPNGNVGGVETNDAVVATDTSHDIDGADLEAEFERGLSEGRAETMAAVDEALAKAQADFKVQLEAERSSWINQESTVISQRIADEVDALKEDLSSAVAKGLKPVLLDAVYARAVSEFSNAVEGLSDGTSTRIVVTGSSDLLAGIESSLGGRVEISTVPGEVSELSVSVDETRLSTTLDKWVSAIEGTAV